MAKHSAALSLTSLLQTRLSSEYIGGLVQTPDRQQAIAAAGDGHLTLLDMRKAGEKAAEVSCGSPLLCCQTDGQAVAAGTQAGQVKEFMVLALYYCPQAYDSWYIQHAPHMCYTPG